MKTILKTTFASLFITSLSWAQAPAPAPAAPAPAGMGASLNKAIAMYVYPAKNQDANTQEKDTQECYKWGVQQSGVDPLNPPDVQAQETATGRDGSAVRGAARGAAAGAAIGAIAGDAGKGAAIGATAGGMGGAAGRRQKQKAQAQQAEKTAQAQEAELMNSFKKAYSTCLSGKGYTVN